FWIGQGNRPFKPGSPMLREYLPKVVTTATSVWRSWKVNNMQAKINSSTAPVARVIGFRFIGAHSTSFVGGGRFVDVRRQDRAAQEQVLPDFFLQIQRQDVLRVGGQQNVLADRFQGTGQRFQARTL